MNLEYLLTKCVVQQNDEDFDTFVQQSALCIGQAATSSRVPPTWLAESLDSGLQILEALPIILHDTDSEFFMWDSVGIFPTTLKYIRKEINKKSQCSSFMTLAEVYFFKQMEELTPRQILYIAHQACAGLRKHCTKPALRNWYQFEADKSWLTMLGHVAFSLLGFSKHGGHINICTREGEVRYSDDTEFLRFWEAAMWSCNSGTV